MSFNENEPKDWDICTPAIPEETMGIFQRHHIIEIGLKHGTITLMLNHKPFGITTYRVDGPYSDHRRSGKVACVSDLKEDLSDSFCQGVLSQAKKHLICVLLLVSAHSFTFMPKPRIISA